MRELYEMYYGVPFSYKLNKTLLAFVEPVYRWCIRFQCSKFWVRYPAGSKGQTKDNTISIYCFSAKHAAINRKQTGWFGISIMCPSGTTCLPVDCELALLKSDCAQFGLVQNGHHHIIEHNLIAHEYLFIWH